MKNGMRFVREPFAVLEQADRRYGPVVRFEMGNNRVVHLIHRPEHIQHVLLDNNRNYHKFTPYSLLKGLFGRGLLFNEGKSWFTQRRLLQPAFQPGHFSTLADGIGQAVVSIVDQWPRTESGQQTDIEVEMGRLSRRVVGQVLFGTDLSDDLHDVLQVDGSKLNFLLGNVPLMPQNRRLQAGMRRLDKAVYDIIAERRSQTPSSPDILNALLSAVDKDSGEKMSDKQLRDEIVTLLFSGFDTTSRTLTWVFHALSKNPQVEAKLHQELHDVLGNRKPTYADIPRLTYTDMLVKETMRVFPANPYHRATGQGRRRNWRLSHSGRFVHHAVPVSGASRFIGVGKRRRFRAGAFCCRQGIAAPFRLFSLWRRPAPVHRQRLGDDDHSNGCGHHCATVSLRSLAQLQSRARHQSYVPVSARHFGNAASAPRFQRRDARVMHR
jgi:cytochrome P450